MSGLDANYRIERYNGRYRVEVLDKPVGHWYVVASGLKDFNTAVSYCEKNFEQ